MQKQERTNVERRHVEDIWKQISDIPRHSLFSVKTRSRCHCLILSRFLLWNIFQNHFLFFQSQGTSVMSFWFRRCQALALRPPGWSNAYVQLDTRGNSVRSVLQGTKERIHVTLGPSGNVFCASAREEELVIQKQVSKSTV